MKNRTHLLKFLKFSRVLNCAKDLDKISAVKNFKIRSKLISQSKACIIDAISEIAKNCLKGNIPLKSCDFKKLSTYKNLLRAISKKSSIQKRRKLISQKGGFLSLLIPPALSLIASIVGDL